MRPASSGDLHPKRSPQPDTRDRGVSIRVTNMLARKIFSWRGELVCFILILLLRGTNQGRGEFYFCYVVQYYIHLPACSLFPWFVPVYVYTTFTVYIRVQGSGYHMMYIVHHCQGTTIIYNVVICTYKVQTITFMIDGHDQHDVSSLLVRERCPSHAWAAHPVSGAELLLVILIISRPGIMV